jgi:hypothetical protein
LAAIGHGQALGGRERRVSIMLLTSVAALMTFYSFVEFGRYSYDGLGPRYVLPAVVMLAPGTAAVLAPLLRGFVLATRRGGELFARLRAGVLALGTAAAFVAGVYLIAPLVYPVARDENVISTAPLRAAAKLGLKNAIVVLEPERSTGGWWNVAQNAPFERNPDVLFLSRRTPADEACIRRTFPRRKLYRGERTETLTPF